MELSEQSLISCNLAPKYFIGLVFKLFLFHELDNPNEVRFSFGLQRISKWALIHFQIAHCLEWALVRIYLVDHCLWLFLYFVWSISDFFRTIPVVPRLQWAVFTYQPISWSHLMNTKFFFVFFNWSDMHEHKMLTGAPQTSPG